MAAMRHKAILVATALAAAGLCPALPAAAATPTHVAIVIAGKGAYCIDWYSGISGDDVLQAATHGSVEYRPTDGLITQIDGTPANNRADETHYWSYWHDTGSGWRYSNSGASASYPKAGTVEGWHFINGSSTATPPPTRAYSSICHDPVVSAPPPPRPPPSPTATTAANPPAPPSSRSATRSATTRTTASAPATASATRHATSAVRSRAARAHPTRSSTTASATPAASSTDAPTTPATLRASRAADTTPRIGHGSAWPTVLVASLVLVLGGTAALLAQRRRRS